MTELREALLAELAAMLEAETKPPGEGWFSLTEIAAAVGSKPDSMRRRVALLVESGAWEMWRRAPNTPTYYRKVSENR